MANTIDKIKLRFAYDPAKISLLGPIRYSPTREEGKTIANFFAIIDGQFVNIAQDIPYCDGGISLAELIMIHEDMERRLIDRNELTVLGDF